MWYFFPNYLFLVKLGRVIWNGFLLMKTNLSLHLYHRKTIIDRGEEHLRCHSQHFTGTTR